MLPLHPLWASLLATGASAFQKTPIMGYNSYNQLACSPSEATITRAIQAMSDRGFVAAGYTFFQVDCGWAARDGQRNASTGALKIDTNRFPKGLLPLSNLARSKGMKWSMYSNAGVRMCDTQVPSPVLGSLGREVVDARYFASLGTEYVKYDNCYVDGPSSSQNAPKDPRTDFVTRYKAMWDALQAVGISGMLICQWGAPYSTPSGLQGPAQWAKGISTSFRLSDDITQGWASTYRIYNQAVHVARSDLVGPGYIADMDMLEVGNAGMTIAEQATHFAAWAMLKSTLMISTDVAALSPAAVAILQNADLVAINQDPLVKPIKLVQRWTNNRDLWAGDLANGDIAVLVVDLSNAARTLAVTLAELGIASATIKDLWTGKTTMGATNYSSSVAAHGSIALRLSNIQRATGTATQYKHIAASSGSLSNGAAVQPCAGCSAANKVGYLGGSRNGAVVLSGIFTSQATQNVMIDYINGEVGYMGGSNERLASISVNGGAAQIVSFPLSGYNWERDNYRGYAVQLSGFSTTGPNTIRISGYGSGYAPDLDRVGVVV